MQDLSLTRSVTRSKIRDQNDLAHVFSQIFFVLFFILYKNWEGKFLVSIIFSFLDYFSVLKKGGLNWHFRDSSTYCYSLID